LLCALWMGTAQAQEGPRVFAPGVVSTGFDDSHLSFTPDGQTIYFLRNTPDFYHWTILISHRVGHAWSRPMVAPFSGRYSDADVFVTQDRQRLFFISTRPVAGVDKQETDIWMMRRDRDGWGAPAHVPELSSPGYEWFPTLTESGTIYFGSERDGGHGLSDIWRARWLGDRFDEPENLGPAFNTSDQEIEPLVAPDESWLIFAARGHVPSAGSYDLYISYNCDGAWSQPAPLAGGVNSAGWDFAPHLAPDRRTFYFTSNRADTAAPFAEEIDARGLERILTSAGNGLRDIYSVDVAALGLRRPCGREG